MSTEIQSPEKESITRIQRMGWHTLEFIAYAVFLGVTKIIVDFAIPLDPVTAKIEHYFSILLLLMLCFIWAKPFINEIIGSNPYVPQEDNKLEMVKFVKPEVHKSKNKNKKRKR